MKTAREMLEFTNAVNNRAEDAQLCVLEIERQIVRAADMGAYHTRHYDVPKDIKKCEDIMAHFSALGFKITHELNGADTHMKVYWDEKSLTTIAFNKRLEEIK